MKLPSAQKTYDAQNEAQFRRAVEFALEQPAVDFLVIGRGVLKEVDGALIYVSPAGTETVVAPA
jgi:hypothetical protein